jgi:Glycosyltransferase
MRPRHFVGYFPAAKFLWVGDGTMSAQWDRWVAQENLGGVISHVGWQADVIPFLFAGDLLLHVAEYEDLPLAIAEAMSAGLPCAVTRNFASEIPFLTSTTFFFR